MHSCTLTPTLVAPDFASKTNATFSKATIDVLEVISDLVRPPFLLLQLALLSQVKKVSHTVAQNIIHEGYSARARFRYDKEHDLGTFVPIQLGYSSETRLPYRSRGKAHVS